MTATQTQAEAKYEVLSNCVKRLQHLQTERANANKQTTILCWSQYSLGVKFDENKKPITVGIEYATPHFHANRDINVYNGKSERAVWRNRIAALDEAIKQCEQTMFQMVEMFEKVPAEDAAA